MFYSLSSFLYSVSPMQEAFKTPGKWGRGGEAEGGEDIYCTNWTELSQSRARRKLVNPMATEAHISPHCTLGSSLTVLVTVLKEGF